MMSAVVAAVLYLVGIVCFIVYGMFVVEVKLKTSKDLPFPLDRHPLKAAKVAMYLGLLGLVFTLGSFSVMFYW